MFVFFLFRLVSGFYWFWVFVSRVVGGICVMGWGWFSFEIIVLVFLIISFDINF